MQRETAAAAAAATEEEEEEATAPKRNTSSKKRRRSSKKLPRIETEPDPTVFDVDWVLVAKLTAATCSNSTHSSSRKRASNKKSK
jgi:hypothetical protein